MVDVLDGIVVAAFGVIKIAATWPAPMPPPPDPLTVEKVRLDTLMVVT